MCLARALAGCLLLLAALEPSALTVGHLEGGLPDDASEHGSQLARHRAAQQDDQEFGSDTTEYPGCDPNERHSLALKFRKQYKAQWASGVKAAFASVEGPAYLIVGEVRQRKLLRNFFAHAKNLSNIHSTTMRIVSVQLDGNGTLECQRARDVFQADMLDLHCVDLGGWLPAEFFGKRTHSAIGSCIRNIILWSKPEIFLTAIQASKHEVMMIDTDVVIYDDLFKLGKQILAQNTDYQIVVAHENHGFRNPNTGVVLATKSGSELIEWWIDANIDFVNSYAGDQSAFQSVWKINPDLWSSTGVFKPSDIGQCGVRGAWATHYNCLGGQGMKEAVMVSNKDWNQELSQHKFGRHRNNSLHKIDQFDPVYVDDDSDLVTSLMVAGDWWID